MLDNTEVPGSRIPSILERQFPELAPVRSSYLGAGMDSVVYTVNERWAFRFPMRADVERQLFVEQRILPALARQLPIPIPVPAFAGRPDADFPMHFVGYELLPGVPGVQLDQSRIAFQPIARQLGEFLTAVHGYPIADAERLGVRRSQLEDYFGDVRASALESLDDVRRIAPDAPIARVRAYLETLAPLPPAPWPPTLTHNDLAADHILLDAAGARATGVIDWGDVAITDATVDFVGLFAWRGEPFVRAVLEHYAGPVDARVVERLRPWTTFRGVQDILFGAEHALPDMIRLGVEALRFSGPA